MLVVLACFCLFFIIISERKDEATVTVSASIWRCITSAKLSAYSNEFRGGIVTTPALNSLATSTID